MAVQLTTTSETRPADPPPGTILLETDTQRMIVWDGSGWQLYLPDGRQHPEFGNSRSIYVQSNFTSSSVRKYFQVATHSSAPTLQVGVHTVSISLWFCFHTNSNIGTEDGGYLFTSASTAEVATDSIGQTGLPRTALEIIDDEVHLSIEYHASGQFNFDFQNPAGTSLADGNWHHLVFVSEINPKFNVNTHNMQFQVKCWVDGTPATVPGTYANDTRITGFSDTSQHGEVIPEGTSSEPMFDSNGDYNSASGLDNHCTWRIPGDDYTIRTNATNSPTTQNALLGGGPGLHNRDQLVFGMIRASQGQGSNSNSGIWLDEVAIWDTALTTSDVTSIYSGGASIDLQSGNANYQSHGNLKHWWRMGDDEDIIPGASTAVTGVKDSVTGFNGTTRTGDGDPTGNQRSGFPQLTAPVFTDFSVKSDGTTDVRPDAETEYDGI